MRRAHLCLQCNVNENGEATSELAGLTTEEETGAEFFSEVECRTCGLIQVDHDGRFLTDCLMGHQPPVEDQFSLILDMIVDLIQESLEA